MPRPEPWRIAAGWLTRGIVVLGSTVVALRVALPRQTAGGSAARERAPEAQDEDTTARIGRGHAGEPASRQARRAGHETADMSAGLMARLVIGLGVVAALVVFGMVGMHSLFTRELQASRPGLTAEQTAPITPPLPHLQADPVKDLATLNAQEDKLLGSYGWVDPAHTRARIPIDRAMALIVGKSLDAAP